MLKYTTLLLLCCAFLSINAQNTSPVFDHQAVLVSDLEVSTAFYRDIMLLEEIENKTEMDHIRWFSLGMGTELHIISAPEIDTPPGKNTHLALKIEDLGKFMKHLESKNIPFENWQGTPGTTNARPDGVLQIYLQDPDGYWIEINNHE